MNVYQLSVRRGVRKRSVVYQDEHGYAYHMYLETESAAYFRCVDHRTCPVRSVLKVQVESNGSMTGCWCCGYNHNHPPHDISQQYANEREHLVNQARCLGIATFQEIFNHERHATLHFADQLKLHRLYPAMNRARRSVLPPEPQSLLDLGNILKDERYTCLTATTGFTDCIYGGFRTAPDGSNVMLFMSRRCASFMKIVPSIFMSKCCLPSVDTDQPFTIFTIATVWDNIVIPLAWCVLERISHESLVSVFLLLRAHVRTWMFDSLVSLNNEEAHAFEMVFAVKAKFSLFEYINEILNFIRETVNADSIRNNEMMKKIIGYCCCLPVLPEELIPLGTRIISQHAKSCGYVQLVANDLLAHIHLVKINCIQRHVNFSVCASAERTHNGRVKLMNKIRRNVNVNDIHWYSVIRFLVRIAEKSHKAIAQIEAGRKPSGLKCRALTNEKDIKMLLKSLARPPCTISLLVSNLLNVTSIKLHHVISEVWK